MLEKFGVTMREGLEEKWFIRVAVIERLIVALPRSMRSSFEALLNDRENRGVGNSVFVSPDSKNIILMPGLGIEADSKNTKIYSFDKPLRI